MAKEIIIALSVAIILLLGVIGVIFLFVSPFYVYNYMFGQVLDCETNQPISGAEITICRGTLLTWTNCRSFETKTDNFGNFNITYNFEPGGQITVKKDGYYRAIQFEGPGKNISIKLLKGNVTSPLNMTEYCRFDCQKSITKITNSKSEIYIWDNCTNPR
jgi:hypothetical protein